MPATLVAGGIEQAVSGCPQDFADCHHLCLTSLFVLAPGRWVVPVGSLQEITHWLRPTRETSGLIGFRSMRYSSTGRIRCTGGLTPRGRGARTRSAVSCFTR